MLNKFVPGFLQGRIVLSLLLCFVLGIIFAYYIPLSLLWAAVLSFVVLLLCLFLFRFKKTLAAFLPLAFMLGIFLCAANMQAINSWDFKDGQTIEVVGELQTLELAEATWQGELKVDSINGEGFANVKVMVYADIDAENPQPLPGAKIRILGTVFEPKPYQNANTFVYSDYLQKQGIVGSVSSSLTGKIILLEQGSSFYPRRITEWLLSGFEAASSGLSERQAALVSGVFLGDKSGLDYTMKNALGLTGSLHAFAVSGLHVGYLVAFVLLLLGGGYRRRKLRFVVCLVLLLLYIGMTGAPASVLRASLMTLCLLLASVFDEKNDSVTALSVAAFLCLIIHPLWLFSAGFQLSFAAAIGIIGLRPLFAKLFAFLPTAIGGFLSVTFAATISTLPLVSYYFYHISWLGWLLSPLVILAAGVTVILSFLATLIAIFSPAVAGIFVEAGAYAIDVVYVLNEKLAALPFVASITGAVPAYAVALFLLLLLFLPYILRRFGKLVCTVFLLIIVLLFSMVAPRAVLPRHSLSGAVTEIVFLDVGQGDCSLIITPDNKTILIDGGGDMWNPGDVGEYSLLPYLKSRGINKIDLVINSHPHDDHVDGLLSVLQYLQVNRLLYADIWQGEPLQEELLSLAESGNVELLVAKEGDTLLMGEYLSISIYHPSANYSFDKSDNDEANDASIVCEISIGEIDVLYTGDIGGSLLSSICAAYEVEAEIIKIPHHGSNTGYEETLAEILDSETAIFSVGENNSYGHPTLKVIEYWQEYGEIFRTDIDGAVSIFTNGEDYQIFTYYMP